MPVPYPDWLPLAQKPSKNMTFQTPFRADQPAVGAPLFEPMTTDVATSWSLTWILTLAQERAFQMWLRSPKYLNNCNEWFTMRINLGGSGLQEQTLHFQDYPVQTSINGAVATWTANVICVDLNNEDDEYDEVIVELSADWYSWLDEVVNQDMPIYPYAVPLDLAVTDADPS